MPISDAILKHCRPTWRKAARVVWSAHRDLGLTDDKASYEVAAADLTSLCIRAHLKPFAIYPIGGTAKCGSPYPEVCYGLSYDDRLDTGFRLHASARAALPGKRVTQAIKRPRPRAQTGNNRRCISPALPFPAGSSWTQGCTLWCGTGVRHWGVHCRPALVTLLSLPRTGEEQVGLFKR